MTRHSLYLRLLERIRARSGYLTFSNEIDFVQHRDPPARLVWASELALPAPGSRIADIGCWTGGLLSLLVPLAPAELVGVDVSGPWLSVARERIPSATFVEVSAFTDLPAALHGHFEIVFFLETLEHLPRGSQLAVVRTLASLLAPGGKLVLSTPAAGLAALLDPAWYLVGHRHYRLKTLVDLLASADLDVSDHHYSGNLYTAVDTLLLYFSKHVLHRPYFPASAIKARTETGLYPRRRLGAANIWLQVRRRADGRGSPLPGR